MPNCHKLCPLHNLLECNPTPFEIYNHITDLTEVQNETCGDHRRGAIVIATQCMRLTTLQIHYSLRPKCMLHFLRPSRDLSHLTNVFSQISQSRDIFTNSKLKLIIALFFLFTTAKIS